MPLITPRFLRFAVTGFINTAVDFSVFTALILASSLSPFSANLLAFGAAVCCSFLLNRHWTFSDRQNGSFFDFIVWMSTIALTVSWCLQKLIDQGATPLTAKVFVTVIAMGLTFQVMKWFIFRPVRSARVIGVMALSGALAFVALTLEAEPKTGLPDEMYELYANETQPRQGDLRVYHLGHSLVGRRMPEMLAQLAGSGHTYGLQLGWGTSLNQHLEGPEAILGYSEENNTTRFDPLDNAIEGGAYDALVFTEMIGLEAAIRYRDSSNSVAKLVEWARDRNPEIELYLYETWHPLDEGDWLARIPEDFETMWLPSLLAPAIRAAEGPVTVIPAGTVMARLVSEVEGTPGGIGGMLRREDLFAKTADGAQDQIHLNDLGTYLVALTHYAVLYGKSPEGLPFVFPPSKEGPAFSIPEDLALTMHRVVWETVRSSPLFAAQGRSSFQ